MRPARAALSRIQLTALIAAACLLLLWIFTASRHAYLVSRTDARAGIGDGSLSAFRSPVGEPPLRDASFLRGPTIDADASGWIIDLPFSNLALVCLFVALAAWLAALRIKRLHAIPAATTAAD
jgi:hypothetical protein